ncbi:MAG: tetratricopeptide repeat protein [Gemmatimonadaceae bacterium]
MAAPDFNIGPSGPVQPVSTSRALTRVTPVAPQPVTNPEGAPLGRSGLTARDLLAAPDLIVVRSKTPGLALGMGLEQARGALIRNQPADALMALDEVWEGARNTESGWYLRGGSLTLLGLPGEASRVANQILEKRPESIANRFLLSLTSLAAGDLSAARQALADAAARRPGDALLIVQEALLLARNGNREDAEQLLRRAAVTFPGHPAIQYGRSLMRQAIREGSRVFDDPLSGLFNAFRTPRSTAAFNSIDAFDEGPSPIERPEMESRDVLNDALSRIGARVSLLSPEQTVTELRMLLQGLSSGGSLSLTISPSRAFSARSVISALIDALHNNESIHGQGWEARSIDGQWQRTEGVQRSDDSSADAFRATVRQLVNAMREGRTKDVEAILRRLDPAVDESKRAMLRGFAGVVRDSFATPALVRSADTESMLLPALRLGLGLLPPDETVIANRQSENRTVSGVSYAIDASRGWGTVGIAPHRLHGDEAAGIGLTGAVALLVVALIAFLSSHALVGFASAAAAAWLALRQGTARRNARRNENRGSYGEAKR